MGCEGSWWWAVGVLAGPWMVGPPVAQRIAATWDHKRARKARRRCMRDDVSERRGRTSYRMSSKRIDR